MCVRILVWNWIYATSSTQRYTCHYVFFCVFVFMKSAIHESSRVINVRVMFFLVCMVLYNIAKKLKTTNYAEPCGRDEQNKMQYDNMPAYSPLSLSALWCFCFFHLWSWCGPRPTVHCSNRKREKKRNWKLKKIQRREERKIIIIKWYKIQEKKQNGCLYGIYDLNNSNYKNLIISYSPQWGIFPFLPYINIIIMYIWSGNRTQSLGIQPILPFYINMKYTHNTYMCNASRQKHSHLFH